jgi:hypothetical protein
VGSFRRQMGWIGFVLHEGVANLLHTAQAPAIRSDVDWDDGNASMPRQP